MKQNQLLNQLPDQSKHLIWMIDPDFQLIYAQKGIYTSSKILLWLQKS
jgi:hypothetical protein